MRKLFALFFAAYTLTVVAGNTPVRTNTLENELKMLKLESERLQTDLTYLRAGGIEKAYAGTSFADLKDSLKTIILFGFLSVLFIISLSVRLFFRVLHNFGRERKRSPVLRSERVKTGAKLLPSVQ